MNIRPLTRQWEQRSEEEKMKKLQIEREIQQKKEEYLKLLEEKARIEQNERYIQKKLVTLFISTNFISNETVSYFL